MNDKARIYYQSGEVVEYADQQLAYDVYLSLRKGIRAAFRGKGDNEPVYSWDYVDKPI